MILCAALDTLFESQEMLSSHSTSMMMLDKSQSCRSWFESMKKSKMFLTEMHDNIKPLFEWISTMGCSKRELTAEVRTAMENITHHIGTHAHDVDKSITDMYVLHFHPECGEHLYKKMRECAFVKSNMQKFDDSTSEILAEATKAVKAARVEADKKRKEIDKHMYKNTQGPYNTNDRFRNNTRDTRQSLYQSNSGGGRGSSYGYRNDYYDPNGQRNDYYNGGRGTFYGMRHNYTTSHPYQMSQSNTQPSSRPPYPPKPQ